MASLKKCYNLSANSILESMIALTIISVCLYIAILVFASVFTPKTSARFYTTQNNVNSLFFLAQVQSDSLYNSEDENLSIEEEAINHELRIMTVEYKDSTKFTFKKNFYIPIE